MWAINFNGLFLDFSALCKCRLIALRKPFKFTDTSSAGKTTRKVIKILRDLFLAHLIFDISGKTSNSNRMSNSLCADYTQEKRIVSAKLALTDKLKEKSGLGMIVDYSRDYTVVNGV